MTDSKNEVMFSIADTPFLLPEWVRQLSYYNIIFRFLVNMAQFLKHSIIMAGLYSIETKNHQLQLSITNDGFIKMSNFDQIRHFFL